jgi:hypothetical protein
VGVLVFELKAEEEGAEIKGIKGSGGGWLGGEWGERPAIWKTIAATGWRRNNGDVGVIRGWGPAVGGGRI